MKKIINKTNFVNKTWQSSASCDRLTFKFKILSIGEVASQATPLSSMVFTRWDFGITEPKGIKIQQSDILTNLKIVLASGTRIPITKKIWAIRVFVNVLVLGTLAGFLAAIYFVTANVPELQQDYDCNEASAENESDSNYGFR